MCAGLAGGVTGSTSPSRQERGDRQRCEQLFVISGEEEAVPLRAGAAAGPPHPLQQGRGAQGRTNLHHAIEVTDIYAELQGAGGDDDAIRLGGKGLSA